MPNSPSMYAIGEANFSKGILLRDAACTSKNSSVVSKLPWHRQDFTHLRIKAWNGSQLYISSSCLLMANWFSKPSVIVALHSYRLLLKQAFQNTAIWMALAHLLRTILMCERCIFIGMMFNSAWTAALVWQQYASYARIHLLNEKVLITLYE